MTDKDLNNASQSLVLQSIDSDKSGKIPAGESLSGYLYKKTKDGRWQKRWFECNGTFLAYYKSRRKEKLLAALSLPQTGDIRLENTNSSNENEKSRSGFFTIELNSRTYVLQAKSEEEAQKWVVTLNNLKYQGYPDIRNSSDSKETTEGIKSSMYRNASEPGITFSESNYPERADWKKSNRSIFNCLCCTG
jgi:hypothetical protein